MEEYLDTKKKTNIDKQDTNTSVAKQSNQPADLRVAELSEQEI